VLELLQNSVLELLQSLATMEVSTADEDDGKGSTADVIT
jgi:hypothetical protein